MHIKLENKTEIHKIILEKMHELNIVNTIEFTSRNNIT